MVQRLHSEAAMGGTREMSSLLTDMTTRRPWSTTLLMLGGTLVLAALAVVPLVMEVWLLSS